jgi:predicted nucleotidyltransferase
MKIDPNSEIHGIPAIVLRAALRKNQFRNYTIRGFAELLEVGPKKALSILKRLESEGVVSHSAHDGWENTIKGNSLANASAASLISRSTAENALNALIGRASVVNSDARFAYVVSRITVFGSYLSDAPRISDVDVCIRLRRRYSDSARQAAVEEEAKRRHPVFHSFLEDIGRPEREVWNLLKARSRSLQIAVGIPDGAKSRVVFEET